MTGWNEMSWEVMFNVLLYRCSSHPPGYTGKIDIDEWGGEMRGGVGIMNSVGGWVVVEVPITYNKIIIIIVYYYCVSGLRLSHDKCEMKMLMLTLLIYVHFTQRF